MKHKSGIEINVVSEINVDNRRHFICKMNPFYKNELLVSLIILPASEFEHNDGSPWCEIVNNDPVDSDKVRQETSTSA